MRCNMLPNRETGSGHTLGTLGHTKMNPKDTLRIPFRMNFP